MKNSRKKNKILKFIFQLIYFYFSIQWWDDISMASDICCCYSFSKGILTLVYECSFYMTFILIKHWSESIYVKRNREHERERQRETEQRDWGWREWRLFYIFYFRFDKTTQPYRNHKYYSLCRFQSMRFLSFKKKKGFRYHFSLENRFKRPSHKNVVVMLKHLYAIWFLVSMKI